MLIKLDNSRLTLLLPDSYTAIKNAMPLFKEMFCKRKTSDIQMYRKLTSMV